MKIKKSNSNKGISLIALVMTIVILIILAMISIRAITGESIFAHAMNARESTEIAQILQKAEVVKMNSKIEWKVGESTLKARSQRPMLLSALREAFSGSTLKSDRIILENKKYDVIVKDTLEIIVQKHVTLKNGELVLLEDHDSSSTHAGFTTIGVTPILGGVESYDDYATEILAGKNDSEKEALFMEGDRYWNKDFLPEEALNTNDIKTYLSLKINNEPLLIIPKLREMKLDSAAAKVTARAAVEKRLEIVEETKKEEILEEKEPAKLPETLEEYRLWLNNNRGYSFESVNELLISFQDVKPEDYFGKSYQKYAQEYLDNHPTVSREEILMEGDIYQREHRKLILVEEKKKKAANYEIESTKMIAANAKSVVAERVAREDVTKKEDNSAEILEQLKAAKQAGNFSEFVRISTSGRYENMENINALYQAMQEQGAPYVSVDDFLIKERFVDNEGYEHYLNNVSANIVIEVVCEKTGEARKTISGETVYFDAYENGTYKFNATASTGSTATLTTNVNNLIEIQLNKSLVSLDTTEQDYPKTATLTASITNGNGNEVVEWYVENANIAEITAQNGNTITITAKNRGNTYIGATYEMDKERIFKECSIEVIDQSDLVLKVNSGEDGIVTLPFTLKSSNRAARIDWGDGTKSTYSIFADEAVKLEKSLDSVQEVRKVASLNSVKISAVKSVENYAAAVQTETKATKAWKEAADPVYTIENTHTYAETNKEYTVKIWIDNPDRITWDSFIGTRDKIIEIVDWGELRLPRANFRECQNLRRFANPKTNSFTESPILNYAFYNCTGLTGDVPALWEIYTEGETCFGNCTQVSNYDIIPERWKTVYHYSK